jgi:hypothetical protein
MPHRQFLVLNPADANYHQLYPMLTALPGAVPVNGILPDRVSQLTISNGPAGIFVADSNFANHPGTSLGASVGTFTKSSDRNVICLRDFYIAGNAAQYSVDIDFI